MRDQTRLDDKDRSFKCWGFYTFLTKPVHPNRYPVAAARAASGNTANLQAHRTHSRRGSRRCYRDRGTGWIHTAGSTAPSLTHGIRR